MPSFWNRMGLAIALMASVGGAGFSFGQSAPCASGAKCTQAPGCAHVGPPSEKMIPMPPEDSQDTPPTMPPEMPPEVDLPPEMPALDPGTADLAFNAAEAGLTSPDVAFRAPNMMGDLLKGFRNVTFPYNGAGDFATVDSAGATIIRNSKVSENNSAIPRDRVSFRYNFFKNANDVDGFTLGDSLGIAGLPEFRAVIPASRSYDAHFYTFGVEKTFLDNMASIEVRVPFASTLASDLDLIGSRPIDPNLPLARNIPNDGVLGETDVEFQDISFILKGVLWQSQCRDILVSGGAGITMPTGEDVNLLVVDTYDDIQGLEPSFEFDTQPLGFGNNIRTRDIWVENEIWDIAPFLAVAALPTERTFVNGFVQLNLPVGSSKIRYREQRVDVVARDSTPNATGVNQFGVMFGPNGSEGMFEERAKIDDQALLQLDIGGGYWLYRNPHARRVTGVASLLELHYTTTIEDADIESFQPGGRPLFIQNQLNFEGPTRVGNLANRVDILNGTIGGVVELANRATLAVAYVAPLRDEFDRTFDGELNVQFNLYR